MIKFEKVSRFADADFNLPVRKTKNSAGYDFEVAEDIVIPSYDQLMYDWKMKELLSIPELEETGLTKEEILKQLDTESNRPHSLKEISELTKSMKAKPTLVSTGVKCYLEPSYYLELSVRSSTPLKYWLILANSVGIIDADYADNPDNEGEIFFQIINLSPFPIQLRKGDIIGQGIIKKYEVTDDDYKYQKGERAGGFGSTSATQKNLRSKAGIYDDAMPEDIKIWFKNGSYIYTGETPTVNFETNDNKSQLEEALKNLQKSLYNQLGMSAT